MTILVQHRNLILHYITNGIIRKILYVSISEFKAGPDYHRTDIQNNLTGQRHSVMSGESGLPLSAPEHIQGYPYTSFSELAHHHYLPPVHEFPSPPLRR